MQGPHSAPKTVMSFCKKNLWQAIYSAIKAITAS